MPSVISKSLTITDIWAKTWILIIAGAILGGFLGSIVGSLAPSVADSTTRIIVSPRENSSQYFPKEIANRLYQATYSIESLAQSQSVLNRINADLGTHYNGEWLRNNLSLHVESGTVLSLNARSESSTSSIKILNSAYSAIAKEAEFTGILDSGNIQLSKVVPAIQSRTFPTIYSTTILGFFAGILVATLLGIISRGRNKQHLHDEAPFDG